MFGSFLYGALGRICQIAAVVLLFILLGDGASVGATFAICSGLAVFGSYLVYLSRHTVRVRG
jgi:hypothetical protein